MSTTRIRASLVAAVAAALVGSTALAGCSISAKDDDPEPPTSATGSDPTPSDQPAPAPTETASSTPTATATVTVTPTPAPTPEAALLAAADLPQLNPTSPWTQGPTRPAGPRPFGLCQKFDLLTIGAVSAVERRFTSGTDTAGQTVAEFPDAQNTVRASKVIEAWHRDCASRVKGTAVNVRPITEAAVPAGQGWWYLVSFERRGEGHFHSLGLVVSGARMTLIRMDHDGQDHNYEPGQDPMELAVKAAAARLG
jgi:hypothetical protein